jgi:glutathione S-transferase
MAMIKLLGLRISVYTRIARLVLEEKEIEYDLEEVDIFADGGAPAEYLAHNPFGTIPRLIHGEFDLFETTAITRYIDETFPGTALQPMRSAQRARMNQIISILDCYSYRAMVWDIYVQRVVVAGGGGLADETLIVSALPTAQKTLQQLDLLRGDSEFLAGELLSLADLHAYPMLRYFVEAPEGAVMLESFPRLQQWMGQMQNRPSVCATSFHWTTETANGF